MRDNSPTLLVLAAGMGSRYGSLKQLDRFGPSGETIIDYSVYDAIKAGFGKVVFVVRNFFENEFREKLIRNFEDRIAVEVVAQELDMLPEGFSVPANRTKPWGTGHAVLVAAGKINEPFAVINADDFYGRESFNLLADFLRNNNQKNLYGLVGYKLRNTLSKSGSVSRGVCQTENGFLSGVFEHDKIWEKEKRIIAEVDGKEVLFTGEETVSMNMMGLDPSVFGLIGDYFRDFFSKEGENPKAEFYLPTLINSLIRDKLVAVKVIRTPEKWFGVTYAEDKPLTLNKLVEKTREGVYPQKLWGRSDNGK